MSRFEKLFAGLTFRTRTPEYEPGQEIVAFVTGRNAEGLLVRVGDTVLELPGAESDLLERRVRVEVLEFDTASHRGRGQVLEVLDDRG
jgi:hypothetical protein